MATPSVIGCPQMGATEEGTRGRWSAELKVEGMTCAACSGAVERALKQMKGVKEVLGSGSMHTVAISLAFLQKYCRGSTRKVRSPASLQVCDGV